MKYPIYLDNAATTTIQPAVLEYMYSIMQNNYGNASSIHKLGRESRTFVENARKSIANMMNASPSEIFFTSCGTESTNTAIIGAVTAYKINNIISSPLEHHATLHTLAHIKSTSNTHIHYIGIDKNGHISYKDLEYYLQNSEGKTLVSLMHANNEIGNISNLEKISGLCRKYNALLHIDAVQTVGHYPFDLQQVDIDFLSASAHKFHGPKGSGLLYIKKGMRINPLIHGGSQERNMRAGTENIALIAGFYKALEIASQNHEEDKNHILSLKNYMIEKITNELPMCTFNGDMSEEGLYTVLNIGFPLNEKTELLSIQLDILGICVSGGSACSSGAPGGSHVIKCLYPNSNIVPIRFSFSKYNSKEEIDFVVAKIKENI